MPWDWDEDAFDHPNIMMTMLITDWDGNCDDCEHQEHTCHASGQTSTHLLTRQSLTLNSQSIKLAADHHRDWDENHHRDWDENYEDCGKTLYTF